MKKLFSTVFFTLTVAVFVFTCSFGIAGAVDVKQQLAALAAREASGHELLGVGLDILVLGTAFFTALGVAMAVISWRIAQHRVVRTVSALLCPLYLVPILVSACILV